MKIRLLFFVKLFFLLTLFYNGRPAPAEEFVFKHQKGDRYRIISTVDENVYIDRRLSHQAEILNRIAVEVISETDGKGYHRAVFQTSEMATGTDQVYGTGGIFQWAREYESEFERNRMGEVSIDSKYFMPVVRNVPVFPGRNLQPGDTWSHEGHEVHDFRENFGIRDPYYIPFTADYVYLGERQWKDKTYTAFSVSYKITSNLPAVPGRIWPRRISSSSDQIVYWDAALGQPVAYTENFRYIFELSDGRTVEYRGKAEAEIVESARMDKEKIAEEIEEEISRLEIADVTVRVVDEGITISMDDIQFQADTAIMLPGESEKLDKIVEILLHYQERDILVGGHTALAGTAAGRQRLSTERASVVADYIISHNARSRDRVVVRGYGAERPLADNSTEEGRLRNRRVEIILLEN